MLFSEKFDIKLTGKEEWFDPLLHQDTLLFIDPFSVFKSKEKLFKNSYSEMMSFFQLVFELIAHAGNSKKHLSYRKAENILIFPEVNSICLGYSHTRDGSGTGAKWAKKLADNIKTIISNGITDISHFEELGIFCEGIGPDRLSDITANLLKPQLIRYTQNICEQHNVPMKKIQMQNAYFDYKYRQWCSETLYLPVNPYKKDSPILLVPQDFLNVLPEINTDDFASTIQLSERLRNDINYEIDKNLNKETISQIALENYHLVKEYIDIVEKRKSINFNKLMKITLRYKWYELSKDIVDNSSFTFDNVPNDETFYSKIYDFVNYYKDFIELHSGYKLLWNDSRTNPRNEEDVQLLFKGILDEHCKANDIDLTREVNQGKGPVDFRFSHGYSNRILLEVKLAKNTKFWNGLEKQLPEYMKVDSCKKGIFLVIVYSEKDVQRIKDIKKICLDVCELHDVDIKIVSVDARPDNKMSASKL